MNHGSHEPNKPVAWAGSHLDTFRKSIPLFHQMYILGTIPRPEQTKEQSLGVAIHAMVLEPENFGKRVAVLPSDINMRTKKGKEEYELFMQDNEGKAVIDSDQNELANRINESVRKSRFAWSLLSSEDGRSEVRFEWIDPQTGLRLKGFADRITERLIIDLKTDGDVAINPQTFGRAAANFGYHRQAALYVNGDAIANNRKVAKQFVHVVVSKKPPYDVGVFRLSDSDLQLGYDQQRKTIDELAFCFETGIWEPRYSGEEIVEVQLPRYAHFEQW